MSHVNGFIPQQARRLLENSKYAVFLAVLLSVMPYTTWLSLAIIALVTLKKGAREGALLMMPVMIAFLARALLAVPAVPAIINTLLAFIPCYAAACVLGFTVSWRAVAAFFIVLVALSAWLLQAYLPEFIMAQYQFVFAVMNELHPDLVSKLVSDTHALNPLVLANYLFGLQVLGAVFSAAMPIAMARSVQSQLYYPGGFKQERHALRAHPFGLLLLVVALIAANQNRFIAMNLLPLLVCCFVLAGLSLCLHVLDHKKIRGTSVLLILPVLFLPFVMIPVYVILGSLDSLFNLRSYLPNRAGTTT